MSRTVLIVGSGDSRSISQNFSKYKCDFIEASGTDDALTSMSKNLSTLSAIIIDISAEDPHCLSLLKRIRSDTALQAVPVIITSDSDVIREAATACGADAFLVKPYTPSIMNNTLNNIVRLCETAALSNSSHRDSLTGLLNREEFFAEAKKLIKHHESGYYILSCFDVENFKLINDQYGTDRGDEVLKHIANSIKSFIESCDGIACRFTADRFAILYPASASYSRAISENHAKTIAPACIAHRLRIRIGRYRVNDVSVPISDMFDRAMLAQESIKGRYDIYVTDYQDSMRDNLIHEQYIVNDMVMALRSGEFEPWFQPQYNHATGAIIGSEALIRWRKGGRIIPPCDFIPVFERNGFIYEVDQYLWEQVCIILKRMIDEGKNPLPISVNISRFDLFQKDFLFVICSLVKKYGLPTDLLRLEITESAFSESTKTIIHSVNRLIKLGFTVEIDDFGSGYSSLNTLKDVPASILKLDMKFFENSGDRQRGGNIVESVVRMAKWLGMAVIAEGVEDKAQADYLKSIGCYYIQGYYYAKPMPLADFEKLTEQSTKEPSLTRLRTLKTLNNSEFWNPESMETLIFNSYVGGACIFEFCNEKSELLRINEQYTHELGGLIAYDAQLSDASIVRFLDDENRCKMSAIIHDAIDKGKEASCEVRLTDKDHVEYVRVTVRLIARAAERCLFYCVIVNITEQREAEKRETENSQKLNVIMSNINGGVSAIQIYDDGTSKLIFTNEKYYDLYGYTKEQAQNEKLDIMSAIIPEDFPNVMAKVDKLKKDGEPTIIDYRATKRDGRLVYLRANASLMHMEGYGEVITSVVTDITETRELEDQLRAIVGNINGGVSATVVQNGKHKFIVVNDRFFRMLGFASKEEFEAEGLEKYSGLHPDDRERIIKQFESSDGGKQQYTMEYRIIRKDGELRYIQNNISVIHLFGVNEPVQLSVANDITDLRLAQQKESEAADKLSAVLNHAGNGITAISINEKNPRVIFANDKYFEIVGYSKEEYRKKTNGDILACVHPDDRERVRSEVTEFNKKRGSSSIEFRVIRGNGKIIWVKSIITLTKLAGFDTPVQIAVFSDITAEKNTSNVLRFLNDSAHDILAQSDSDIAINKTLENLLDYFEGDRAYVIEFDYTKEVSCNTYEKCAHGVESELENLQNIPFAMSDYWFDVLKKDQFLVISDVSSLDDSKAAIRSLLIAQSISSLIVAPLWRDGLLVGFIGIDNPANTADQLDSMKAIADYIAILLTRRDLNSKIDNDQKMMAALMDDTPGGFVRMKLTASGNFIPVYSNDGFSKLVGMGHDELHTIYGNDVLEGVHPDDRYIVKNAGESMLANGEAESARFRVKNASGDYIWLTLYGRMTKDSSGEIYLNVYYSDATKQVNEENDRKNLLDNLPTGAALYEYNGKDLSVIHINKSYWELVERDPADYTDSSVLEAIHPDDREMVLQEVEAGIRQKRNADACIRILCGNSEYKPFRICAKIKHEKNGKYLVFASYTPISDQTMSVQEMLPMALSTMMSASGDLSFVKGSDLHYICCSQSAAKIFGFDNQRDLIGKNVYDFFDKEFADKCTEEDKTILATGKPLIDITEDLHTKDGGILLVSTSKYPITDASGNVIGIYRVSRDITSQREKESQLELLTSNIPGGLATYSIDENGIKVLYFNDGFYRFSGYSREEYSVIVGKDPLAFVLDDDKPTILAMIRNFDDNKTDGHVNGCIYRCHTKNGSFRWMSLKTVLAKIGENKYTVNVVQLDITEQQEEKERLRISEEFNRIAIEQSGNIITRFDVKSRTLTLPDSFNPIFVLPHVLNNMPEEQIALGRVSSDTADIYTELFESIVNGKSAGTATYKQNSTKGWRWLEAHFTTIFSNNGTPVSAVISFTDITEKLEKEIVYNKWQQSLNDRPDDSYTLYRCNLSKGTSFDSCEGTLLSLESDSLKMSFDERTDRYAKSHVIPEDREKYLSFMDSDIMLAEYYRGHRSDTLEYRETLGSTGFRWLRLTVDLVEYPSSKDVEAYLMFENIDDQKKADLLTLARSETDPLTGILNRATFISRMEGILADPRNKETHALLMLDIDNFKSVNDTFGHSAGDMILKNLTLQIRSILRRDDLIGRLGGDEFFVFLRDIPDDSAAASKAKQICSLKITADGTDFYATASIGIAMIPKNGNDFDTLYQKADKALYTQKQCGKNGFVFAAD